MISIYRSTPGDVHIHYRWYPQFAIIGNHGLAIGAGFEPVVVYVRNSL